MHGLLYEVVATDETSAEGRNFGAFTHHPNPGPEEKVWVSVWIDGENGWDANIGQWAGLELKKLDDGRFGA